MELKNSSQIASANYNKKELELTIIFRTGSSYLYHPIPQAVYEELTNAKSAGTYFIQNIKNNPRYQCEKIKEGSGLSVHSVKASGTVDKPEDKTKSTEDRTVEELSRDFHKLIGSLK